MTLTARKLFGSFSAPAQAVEPAAETETGSPEYGAWYAQKMASAYAASRGDRTVVQLVRETLGGELPLAA